MTQRFLKPLRGTRKSSRGAPSLLGPVFEQLMASQAIEETGTGGRTGSAARREAKRLRHQIGRAVHAYQADCGSEAYRDQQASPAIASISAEPRMAEATRATRDRPVPVLFHRAECPEGPVEVRLEMEGHYAVTVNGIAVASSDTLFGAENAAQTWGHGRPGAIAAE